MEEKNEYKKQAERAGQVAGAQPTQGAAGTQEQQGQERVSERHDGTSHQQEQHGRTPERQQHGYGYEQGGRPRDQNVKPSKCIPGDPMSSTGIKRGTVGAKGQVGVNYLKIDLNALPPVAYHYDVTIRPKKSKKFLRIAFEEYRVQYLNNISVAFDGEKSCYSVEPLPESATGNKVEVCFFKEYSNMYGRILRFKIELKETNNLEVGFRSLKLYCSYRVFDNLMPAIQCLDVALATPCHQNAVRAGQPFFRKPIKASDLGAGYEAWTGLYQAAVLGDKTFFNVDVSHKSFPKRMSVLRYVEGNIIFPIELHRKISFDRQQIDRLNEFLKDLNVRYTPPPSFRLGSRNLKVVEVTQLSSFDLVFTNRENQQISVYNYFASKHYRIRYPRFPCISLGSTKRPIYVPIELCQVLQGQAVNKKSSLQVQNMIKVAATSTNQRKEKIMELLQLIDHNSFPTVQIYGVEIGKTFITVPSRILPTPIIEYFDQMTTTPSNGAWQMRDSAFISPQQKVHRWAVVHKGLDFQDIRYFTTKVIEQAQALNVSLDGNPLNIPTTNLNRVFSKLKSKKYDLVFVVVEKDCLKYAEVKQLAELKYGVLTQCIKSQSFSGIKANVLKNLLLKVNCKLNGSNHKLHDGILDVKLKNAMLLGADVIHPLYGQKYIPSVVGVAASHDRFGAMYNMQYRLQKSNMEAIEDLESIVLEHLKVYQRYQGHYPEHIIYYRAGVSDGQIPIVKNTELVAIKSATELLRIKAHLACIIVVKRHHTRFFPDGIPSTENKCNNVTPGTVVDRVIVHPNEMQFFMVSHQSAQGTAKPTRYNVIENTGNLSIDLLQTLTFNLCHMFPRCNRVVSYPAPAYLAHLVASRGRVYLEGASRFDDPMIEYRKRLIESNFMMRNPMYFV